MKRDKGNWIIPLHDPSTELKRTCGVWQPLSDLPVWGSSTETHCVLENIQSEFCMTRDFEKQPNVLSFPFKKGTLTDFTCSFSTLFLWVCCYFASFLHSVGSSQVFSHTICFNVVSKPKTHFHCLTSFIKRVYFHPPSGTYIRILRLRRSKYGRKKSFFVFHKSSMVVIFYFCLLNEVFYCVLLLKWRMWRSSVSHTEVAGCSVMTVCHCNLPVTRQRLEGKLKMLSKWIRSSKKEAFIILRKSLFFLSVEVASSQQR